TNCPSTRLLTVTVLKAVTVPRPFSDTATSPVCATATNTGTGGASGACASAEGFLVRDLPICQNARPASRGRANNHRNQGRADRGDLDVSRCGSETCGSNVVGVESIIVSQQV